MFNLNYGILSTSSIAPRFIAAVREMNAGNIVALSSRTKEKAEEAYYNRQVFWNQSEITNLDVSEDKTRPHERCKPKDRDAR